MEDLIYYIFAWLGMLILGAVTRGGPGMVWAFFLGPVGVLIAFFAHKPPNTMKCPSCAEWVKDEAKVCKHCGSELTPYEATT